MCHLTRIFKMRNILILKIFFVVIFSILIASQSKAYSGKVSDISNRGIKEVNLDKDYLSSKAYKMLYENQVKSNEAILQTIYWALGGLGAAILSVFGSNWWFNTKKVEDLTKGIESKLEEIKKNMWGEIELKFSSYLMEQSEKSNKEKLQSQTDISERIENFNLRLNDSFEKIRLEIKDDVKSLQVNYQSQLNNFSENINIQNELLRSKLDERMNSLNEKIEVIQRESKIELDNATKLLKVKIVQSEAALWVIKGVKINALRCYIEEGILSIEVGRLWNLEYVFKSIGEVIDEISEVLTLDVKSFNKFVSLIPDDYSKEKEEFVEKFNKIKIKEE